MSQTGPWSVKGIDQRARDAAREAAGAEGMTLGEYLNKLLLTAESEAPSAAPTAYTPPPPQAAATSSTLDRITRRIEATEARSTLAITGMDQTVLGLVARLENAEQSSVSIAGHVEGLIDELKTTHESLQTKVSNLEADDSAEKNLEAVKSLEGALGKLASHVYEENELAQNETQAIKGRVEAGFTDVTNRVESMETQVEETLSSAAARVERAVQQAELRAEGTARHLSDRINTLEKSVGERIEGAEHASARLDAVETVVTERVEGARIANARLEDVETAITEQAAGANIANARLDSVESDVSGALESMEGTLLRIQDRLNRAENTTDTALKSLESTFEHLDEKIETVASSIDPELAQRLRAEFEARFEDLSASVRETVDNARTDLADEINKAAETSVDVSTVTALQDELKSVEERLAEAEEIQRNVPDGVDPEIVTELKGELEGVQSRLDQSDSQNAAALESAVGAVSEQIETLTSTVEQRHIEIEERQADADERQSAAIEAVGEQVEQITNSFEERFMEIAARDDTAATAAIRDEVERLSENVGEKIENLAEQLDTRIDESEQRSADAIGQIGEQVATVATRIQSRQQEGLRLLQKELDETRKRSDARLTDALSNVSERLELMQSQSNASLSPVQKAIASLATRLDGVEEFNAPPYAEAKPNTELPDFPQLPSSPPLFDKSKLKASVSSDAVSFEPSFEEPSFDEITDEGSTDFAAEIAAEIASTVSGDITEELTGAMLTGASGDTTTFQAYDEDAAPGDDGFEAGIDGWEVSPEVDDSPYSDDFEAIAAAAATINLDDALERDYVAEVPGDVEGENMMDPLAALETLDHGVSEAREADIFDEHVPDIPGDAPVASVEPDMDEQPEIDADTSDYIARARRAAISAADSGTVNTMTTKSKSKSKKKKGGGGGGSKSSGGSSKKVPLLAAASVIAIGGTAVGLHVLRGKQPAPVQTVAVDTYQDPGTATGGAAVVDATDTASTDTAAASDADVETVDAASADASVATPEDLFDAASEVAEATGATFAAIPAPVSVESAANSGNRIAQFQLGQAKIEAGELKAGADLVRKSANKDLPIAQYRLAKLHEKGIGVPKDLKLARDWTEKAAQGGNIKAMHDLAVFMAEGEGGEATYAGAAEWFRKAAEFNIVDSQYNLGVLYEQGLGISADQTEALFWFQVAANNGDAGAPAKVRELSAAVSSKVSSEVLTRSSAWQPGRTNAIANGRFGAQSWNTGNPLQAKGVQTALNAIGYSVGEPDGVIGAETETAIRSYQTKNGLEASGKIDAALIDSLNAKAAGA